MEPIEYYSVLWDLEKAVRPVSPSYQYCYCHHNVNTHHQCPTSRRDRLQQEGTNFTSHSSLAVENFNKMSRKVPRNWSDIKPEDSPRIATELERISTFDALTVFSFQSVETFKQENLRQRRIEDFRNGLWWKENNNFVSKFRKYSVVR